MHSLSADNWHISRYIVQSADIVLSADDRMSADYRQYRISRISVSAEFPNLDIVCTLFSGILGAELTTLALGLVIVFRSIAPPSPITPTIEEVASCSLAEVAYCLSLTFLTEINRIAEYLS